MGDDERFDYLYKFVSTGTVPPGREPARPPAQQDAAHRRQPVRRAVHRRLPGRGDHRHRARCPSDGAFDGTGEWIPLVLDGVSHVPGFTAEEVAGQHAPRRRRRRAPRRWTAARTSSRTRRPGASTSPAPTTPTAARSARKARPSRTRAAPTGTATSSRSPRPATTPRRRRSAGASCWSAATRRRTPSTYFAGFPADQVSPISCPDNVAFDSAGNLWISHRRRTRAPSATATGCSRCRSRAPSAATSSSSSRCPTEAETCGPVVRDEDGMVFVAVQHPGEDGSWAAQHSFFPDYVAAGHARRGTVGRAAAERRPGLEALTAARRPSEVQPGDRLVMLGVVRRDLATSPALRGPWRGRASGGSMRAPRLTTPARRWSGTTEAALGVAGALLALLTRGVRALRRVDRPLHPRGVVVSGTLRTGDDPDAPGAVPPYDGPVVVRVSRSVGLPPPLPDVHGLAFRWQTAGRTNDVLLSSAGTGRLRRFVLAARRSPWSGAFSTVMPFRTQDGPVVLAARPAPTTGPRPEHVVEVELLSARPAGALAPVGPADGVLSRSRRTRGSTPSCTRPWVWARTGGPLSCDGPPTGRPARAPPGPSCRR